MTIPNLAGLLSGPIYAVNRGLGNVWLGARGSDSRFFVFSRDFGYPDTYSTTSAPPPPEDIASNSIVTGAVLGALPCFFVQTTSEKVAAYSFLSNSWTVSALPNQSRFTDAATAVAWQQNGDSMISVFVRAAGGSVWQATWANNCTGQPMWTDLGNPVVPISSLKYALSAVAYVNLLDVNVIELFAAGNDAKLYRQTFNGLTWGGWNLWEAPADTAGHAIGGLHAVAPAGPFVESSVFFVGEVSRRPTLLIPPAGYAFERSGGRLRDHTDPVIGLQTVNFNRPYGWTESSLAERDGRVIVAAMEIRSEPDPQRVGVALSDDDGHTWTTQLIPQHYVLTPDRYFTQGDPSVAVDPQGTAWVLLHEFITTFDTPNGCNASPSIFHSKISLGHAPKGSTTFQFEQEMDLPAKWTVNETNGYPDGPKMVITSDGTQHFAWWKNCVTPPCVDQDILLYTKRSPGQSSFSAPVPVAPPQTAWPHLISDTEDNVYIAWTDYNIYVCPWKNWQNGPGQCSPGVVDVTAQTNACAVSAAGGSVGFTKQGTQMYLRSGGFAFGASAKDAAHIFAAFHATEGTLGTPGCMTNVQPLDIGIIESFDGGLTWTTPLVLSNLPEEQGTDQFMPSVASHDDGTILVTYYDRSPDPTGSLVQQKVAIRRPASSTWFKGVRQRAANQYSDLGLLRHKCGDGVGAQSQLRLMGKYRPR